ncbi:MAG: hypothetical protein JWO89_1578 [Verrucomicrobiaceae bacterium]|nr:hypothetical protein [Verrucomicrobiaceae bacterium]
MNPSLPNVSDSTPVPLNLGELAGDFFQPFVNSTFLMHWGGYKPEPVELVSVSSYNRKAAEGFREPFELIWRASTRDFYVPQGIYSFQHPTAGAFEIFVVPIGPDADGMQFQAIFT